MQFPSRPVARGRGDRRRFLGLSSSAALGLWTAASARPGGGFPARAANETRRESSPSGLQLFLCGDVMTGRGIDQILPHPSAPAVYESYMRSARGYVELAERTHGPVPRPVDHAYVWGDALAELETRSPDLRVINLETSVTTSDNPWPKGINYRMHPKNVPCLTAASIDCCVLANNHVLDWGQPGLMETLETLEEAGLTTAGAGRDLKEAGQPAVFDTTERGRLLVFAYGLPTSGIPPDWMATPEGPGLNVLADLSDSSVTRVVGDVRRWGRPEDTVVVSLHWGGNWGYAIPPLQREFAHHLADAGAADVVHGHSSHHPKGIEVHEGRLILYGCGDFLNDYEGISGHEAFRSDLVLAYFPTLDPSSGRLRSLEMTPFRTRRLRLERVEQSAAEWLRATLDREGRTLGTRVELTADGRLVLGWS